jgi:hypothetical protein
MNLSRRNLLVWLAVCFVTCRPVLADDNPMPAAFSKHFSAEMTITTQNGTSVKQKIFTDDGKVRVEMDMQGSPMISILRPDQQKVYTVMEAQKMTMVMPFDATKMKSQMALATGMDHAYVNLGPETVDGVACTKYQFTSDDKKSYDVWVDNAKKTPVKMDAADHSFTLTFKNYQPGPQDPSLFEPPAGYQMLNMPGLPPNAATLPGASPPAPRQP